METVVDEFVSTEELERFRKAYTEQVNRTGTASTKTTFEYAWCLIRSKRSNENRHGVSLLEDLLKSDEDSSAMRDYLFYLSVGRLKLKEYDRALEVIDVLLKSEPTNQQAIELRRMIAHRMKKDGIIGAAILGGGLFAGGALIAMGVAATVKLMRK